MSVTPITKKERKPIVPLTEGSKKKLRELTSWVILCKKPGENALQGRIENSFNMDFHHSRVQILTSTWWTETRLQDIVTDLQERAPTWDFFLYEIHDEKLPIVINFEAWLDAQAHDPNSIYGVRDKFDARNAPFVMKDDETTRT